MCALLDRDRRRRAKKTREARRQAILLAAAHMFIHQPYSAVKLDDIGRRAGVKKGIVSLYFFNKEELFLLVYCSELDAWFDALERRFEEEPGDLSGEEVAGILAEEIAVRNPLIRLTGLVHNVLEQNVDILPAQSLLDRARKRALALGAVLEERCRRFAPGDAAPFLRRLDVVVAGLAQGANLSGIFQALLEDDDMAVFRADLLEELESMVRAILPPARPGGTEGNAP